VADTYSDLVNSKVGKQVASRLGLPRPARLRRYAPGEPLVPGPVLVGGLGSAPLAARAADLLRGESVEVVSVVPEGARVGAVVLDVSQATQLTDLDVFRAMLGPALKRLAPSGRVVVFGGWLAAAGTDPMLRATRRAVEGVVRSIGKELRAGATANLVTVLEGQEANADAALRFFLSGRSAYVDGQVVQVGAAYGGPATEPADWHTPLAGKVAVVTGAARGIGSAIAEVLSRDGATVVCVDVPSAGEALARNANRLAGTALQLDVTSPDAGRRIVDHARSRHGSLDVMVHNAGITRDKLLANMDAARWNSVMAVNLQAQLDITQALLDDDGALKPGARIVCVSSQSGIAGNRGQTNYAASKAGVIGMVRAWAPAFAERGATINAVAPGFIVTEMTAKMPFGTREVGSRLNSLQQGGLPVDVAETIAWLSQPGSGGVNGQTVRVCGQSLLGA
jgi:3-oxoacyl-[acyl-carrier protein] reductase